MRDEKFQFVIDGDDVSPETVSVSDLFEIVKNLEQAFAIVASTSGAGPEDDLALSIIDIGEGSDTLTFAVSEPMAKAASRISHSIAENDFKNIPAGALPRIRNLWKKSYSKRWTLSFIPDGNGVAPADILPDREILRPSALSGKTTLYGKCERIGGSDKQTMQFALLSGQRISVAVKGKELAEEIARSLHKVIGVKGTAEWDVDTWRLDNFTVEELLDYTPSDPRKAFEALAVAAGGFWEDIDPDEYVLELRDNDEQW